MKRSINVGDVHQAIQHLHENRIGFSQDFIHVRGNGKATGVEEKVNAFLDWLPVASSQDPSDSVPTRVPVNRLVNGYNIIQEGHHSAVAFALMDKKGFYPHGIPTDTNNFGQARVQHIFIEENGRWYISVLTSDRWQLFDKPITKPLRYGRSGISLEDYKKGVDSRSDLGQFLEFGHRVTSVP